LQLTQKPFYFIRRLRCGHVLEEADNPPTVSTKLEVVAAIALDVPR
jgi:hypothetical protein